MVRGGGGFEEYLENSCLDVSEVEALYGSAFSIIYGVEKLQSKH